MTNKETALHYLKLLEEGNTAQINDLFAADALVHSPVYGTMNPKSFYSTLSNDTNNSELEILSIFENQKGDQVALHFNYKWTLKNGQLVAFDVVDIFEFRDNKITDLKIIYDASVTRSLIP